ncbi:MAG: hypothetical protein P8046_10165, partial [Anaerolineales bacterium]
MDQSTKDILVQAVQLLKEGNGQAAAPLLAQVLKQEPKLEQGWYLLGMALDDPAKKRRAFKMALKLNPNNEKAKRQLNLLEEPAPPPPPPPEPEESSPFFAATESPFTEEEDSSPFSSEEFELPDWMQESSFNPEDYTTGALDEDVVNRLKPQEDDKPDWAKSLNPWDNPVLSDEDEPAPPLEEEQQEEQPALSWEEAFSTEPGEEEDQPDWASSQPAQLDETETQDDYLDDLAEEDEVEDAWDAPLVAEQDESAKRISAFFEEEDEKETDLQEEEDPDWLRDMVSDDEKSAEKVARVRLTPDQKRRRWRIVRNVLLVLVLAGLGYLGYQYREQIKSTAEPYLAVAEPYLAPVKTFVAPAAMMLTEKAPITALLTPGYFFTPTPTSAPPSQPTL